MLERLEDAWWNFYFEHGLTNVESNRGTSQFQDVVKHASVNFVELIDTISSRFSVKNSIKKT